ncbi:retrotransposon protein, putative, unclassified [Tanacetum coccineum]
MFDEYFNGDNQVVSRSLVVTDNHQQHDTSLQLNVQPISEPSTSTTTVNAEKNNNNQVGDAHFDDDEFISLFGTPVFEAQNVDPSNMHTFYQRYPSKYHWTKYHPSEQVLRNPSKPVHTRRQLDTDTEMFGFIDPEHLERVYRLGKALYGLKQAPRALYDELSKFLVSKGFTKGEMKFFLGLKIHQFPQGIFINQCKYALEILKKHGMDKCDSIGTPMATSPKLDADLSGTSIDQTKHRCLDMCKSISGRIQFLGDKLVSWSAKKQDFTAMSTAEAEYVSLSASCA